MTGVRILGLGNVLMGDDAFGPYAVRVLESLYELPEGVVAEDVGTPGLDLVPHVADAEILIVLDTVRSEGAPGTLRMYDRDAILKHAPQPRLSPHDPGLKETLLTLALRGGGPREVLLVGTIPGGSATGAPMSGPVRQAAVSAASLVAHYLATRGVVLERRAVATTPDIWWEAAGRAACTK
jgi:hydrogenase maturation protease